MSTRELRFFCVLTTHLFFQVPMVICDSKASLKPILSHFISLMEISTTMKIFDDSVITAKANRAGVQRIYPHKKDAV